MKKRFLHWGLFAIFVAIFLWGLNAQYPLLGDDFFYVFPRLLEGKWHFIRQGFAPLRFAPHLCGGIPQYGNPQDHFYSLPQFLAFAFDLWTATQLSAIVILMLGYVGWLRFGRDVLQLSTHFCHTLALVCLANGFYLMHMAIGHLWVISLPLLGWILWLLFDPTRENARSLMLRTIAFAALTSYILYSGSQTLVFLALLIVLAWLPIDLILRGQPAHRALMLARRFAVFGAGTLILTASKLVAVWSLMRTLDMHATFSGTHADDSIVLFALKSFWAIPQSFALFTAEGGLNRFHEESMLTPHIALIGVVTLIVFLVRTKTMSTARKFSIGLYALVLITFILLLVRGTGIVPETLQQLPLFSALRVPERFLFVLSLFLSLAGVCGAAALHRILPWRISEKAATVAIGTVTLLIFAIAYVPPLQRGEIAMRLPYDVIQMSQEDDAYLYKPITEVFQSDGPRVSDFHYLFSGTTGTNCYEALSLNLPPLRPGSVAMVYDGGFNIYNPACLQYPQENDCKPRDRIHTDDRENLAHFINGEPTTWKLSALQTWADRLTLLGLIAMPLTFLWLARRRIPKKNLEQ